MVKICILSYKLGSWYELLSNELRSSKERKNMLQWVWLLLAGHRLD